MLNRSQRGLLGWGAVLVLGLLAAPLLPPPLIRPVSAVWWLALLLFAAAAWRVFRAWVGAIMATALVIAGLALPIALTAPAWPPELATRLPCPRNWGWLPTWLLRSSPMGSATARIGTARVKICYGRPATRGRTMLGGHPVPFGQLWRTGANEPTSIITTQPVEVAGVVIPAGRTALYSVPGPESWEIILNRSVSQWGIESEYSAEVRAHEIARVIVPSQPKGGPPIERLTLSFAAAAADSTDFVLAWETTRVRIPIRFHLR